MQAIESAYKSSQARIFFVLPGSMKFALERSQKALHFVQRGRILLRCGSAFALSLPSLGVSSLDLGRLFIQAALFSWRVIPGRAKREPQMCNCTSGNLEIPGSAPAGCPGMTKRVELP